jgi:hypothetical protein
MADVLANAIGDEAGKSKVTSAEDASPRGTIASRWPLTLQPI